MTINRKALAPLQYLLLISIVGLALTGMNVYLRRSIQARVRDLTDAFIGDAQLESLNNMESEVVNKAIFSNVNVIKAENIGGGINIASSISTNIAYDSSSTDLDNVIYGASSNSLDNGIIGQETLSTIGGYTGAGTDAPPQAGTIGN